MPALFTIHDLAKTYHMGEVEVHALRQVNLQLDEGRFVVLLGPSGSGKSTLLNILGGLDVPTSGRVLYRDIDLTRADEAALTHYRRQHVGFVFQFYNLMPALSAQKNVELPLLLTRLPGARRRKNAAIALQLVGLADRATHKPSELSGGQQQRVAIARAIVSDPSLLVCDEPTGDLDRQSAEDVLTLLQRLNREHGKTIVMVTHDPKAAEYASHTLHLEKGTLVEQQHTA
jgi:putative ABC transport system ATP-binding protein